jgi:hypothetical protein
MVARPSILVMLVGALASLGASYRTRNFVVEAPTPQIAEQVGQYAEYYRKQKAELWLGRAMPDWGRPCPLRVTVTMGGSGGATSFAFDNGSILSQDMHIEGKLDRLLASVLPHEITHTVFAYHFRCPVPRWADEGGSVLSEDDQERHRHDSLVRQILNTPGRAIPLARLFTLTQYPRDVMVLYAEGYSVTNFLVEQKGRAAFLAFLSHGMRGNWDGAVRAHYGYGGVRELEHAWVQSLRTPARPHEAIASAGGHRPAVPATPVSRVVVRQTVPPAQPLRGTPGAVYRGVAPSEEEMRSARRGSDLPVSTAPSAVPLPSPYAPPAAAPPSGGYPGFGTVPPPPPARLGAPRFDGSPEGYSR